MLAGLATNRGNEGNEAMGGSVVDQSVSRYDQHHQDMSVAQSQNNFNPNAYGMLGGVQSNMGPGPNLPGMQGQGKFTCQ